MIPVVVTSDWSPFECDRSRFKVVVCGGTLCVSLRGSDGVDWPVRLVCCVEYREWVDRVR